jgi:hypothetical protein
MKAAAPLCACVAWFGIATGVRAGPTEDAILAAMRLSEHPNYSWLCSISDDAGSYQLEGKTAPEGYTWLRMPTVTTLARRLGREAEPQVEAFFLGKSAGALRTAGGWMTLAELPESRERRFDERRFPPVRGGANAHSLGIPGGTLGFPPFHGKEKPESPSVYNTAHFGVSHPHEELAIIVSSYRDLEVAADVATGRLSDVGAALLLVRDEASDVTLLDAAGSFKLWLRDGRVARYQLRLEGVVLVGRKKMPARLSSDTVLRNVGSTRVVVPDEVRLKLER